MNPRALIVLLSFLSMLGVLSIDMYLPALPSISHELAITPAATQQTLSVFLFAYAFMTLFFGTLSDTFGRRPVILFSLLVFLVGSVGCAVAPGFRWLLAFRLLQGLSAGAGNVVGRAMIGDLFSGAEAQRMMAFVQMVFGLAPAFAPIAGGWLLSFYGWRAIFFSIVAFTVVVMAISLRVLPESLRPERRHAFHARVILANYWRVGGHLRFIFLCLGNALSFTGVSVYIGSAPAFIYSILHLSERDFGWLFVPLIAGMTVGGLLSTQASHRLSAGFVIRAGFAIMLVSAAANVGYNLMFAAKVPWAIVAPFFYCLGMSLAAPAMNMRILDMFPQTRGMASSLMSFFFMTIFSVISGLLCPLVFDSALHLAETILAGLLLSLLFWWLGSLGHVGEVPAQRYQSPNEVLIEL